MSATLTQDYVDIVDSDVELTPEVVDFAYLGERCLRSFCGEGGRGDRRDRCGGSSAYFDRGYRMRSVAAVWLERGENGENRADSSWLRP